jgi:RNA-directed DNA polymerase
LRAGFFGLKKTAAPGVDGLTWTQYEEGLEANLQNLHARVHGEGIERWPSVDGIFRRRMVGVDH